MLLSQWAVVTGGRLLGADIEVGRVCTDTRSLQAGDVFFALKGENFDAHDFLPQAQAAGAIAAVVSQPLAGLSIPQLQVDDVVIALGQVAADHRSRFQGPLIAVTGSCGKTTVKGMLQSILQLAGPTLATRGNLNNHIGVPLTLLNFSQGDEYAVIEMGASGKGEIAYLAQMARPTVALVNNVMAAHIEGFGSLQGVATEKQRIYSTLGWNDLAVINLDEPYSQKALVSTRRSAQLAFSTQPTSALEHLAVSRQLRLSLAENIREDNAGAASFDWRCDGHVEPIQLRVLGRHNVGNALAAASCALGAGLSPAIIARGLREFGGEKGRMQPNLTPTGAILIDDTYNANPGSVVAAIDYLAARSSRRLLVLGDMKELGADALAEHHRIGTYAAAQGIQSLWLCGELSLATAQGFGADAHHFTSQAELITALRAQVRAGDVLVVKGSRSSRMENIVKGLMTTGESTTC